MPYEASPAEIGTQKALQFKVMDSDGAAIVQIDQTVIVPPASRPGSKVFMQGVIGLNGLKFEHAGDYQFSVLVNGEEKRAVALRVNEPPPEREQ